MLEGLFGSINQEKILVFLYCREKGYATEIANFFETDLSPIQKQLEKLEFNGILISEKIGRTILFRFNPRYAFLEELKVLLKKVLSFYPKDLTKKLMYHRKRPRRLGKPL